MSQNTSPDEQKRPEDAPATATQPEAPPTMAAILERVQLLAPAVVDEWKAAWIEANACRAALEQSLTAPEEVAGKYAAVLVAQLPRVSRRMTRATKALADAYDHGVAPIVIVSGRQATASNGLTLVKP